MEIGDYKKVDDIRIVTNRNPIAVKIANLEIGDGFEVKGVEGDRIQALVSYAQKGVKKRFGRRRLGELHFLVFRREDKK